MTGQTAEIKGVAVGPRWAGLPQYLKNLSHLMGLELKMEVDKGWLRETVRFKIEGSLEKVNEFNSQFDADLAEHNKDAS